MIIHIQGIKMATETKNKLNIYQKIQKTRADLVKLNLKKTGKNDYSKYTYYELGDFLPALNGLMDEIGLMTRFVIWPAKNKQKERALLEVINTENPEEKVSFVSETAEVKIGQKKDGTGGAEPIQNLGGKITYMRRYMLMVAFEIIESDYVESQSGKTSKTKKITIDDASIKKIAGAKNLDELTLICKGIKEKKGSKYTKSLLEHYTKKKSELENENT